MFLAKFKHFSFKSYEYDMNIQAGFTLQIRISMQKKVFFSAISCHNRDFCFGIILKTLRLGKEFWKNDVI